MTTTLITGADLAGAGRGDLLVEGNVIGSVVVLALLAWAVHRTDRERAHETPVAEGDPAPRVSA